MKKYTVLFGNTERKEITAISLLNACKAAHKLAAAKKTIVISVDENEN